MSVVGVTSVGAFVPWRRFDRREMLAQTGWFSSELRGLSRGERAWCSWDEDPITMAVEAVRDCLGDRAGALNIESIVHASTTSPFADRSGAAVIAEATGLGDGTTSLDVGGSYRAATSALLAAARSAGERESSSLIVASEQISSPPASAEEMSSGDAAAAVTVGSGGVIAEFLGGATVTADFVDHFRRRDRVFNYAWEQRWVRDEGVLKIVPAAIEAALHEARIEPSEVTSLVFPSSVKNAAAAVAKAVGLPASAAGASLDAQIGFSGAAAPMVELVGTIQKAEAGDVIVVVGFGAGADAIVLRRTGLPLPSGGVGVDGWIARKAVDNTYLKFLAARELIELASGMRGEFDQKQSMPALWRNRTALLGLSGEEEIAGGAVAFPPPAGSASRTGVAPHALSGRTGTVTTSTADHLAYSLDPPTYYGMVDFEGGGRMSAEYCDVPDGEVAVGSSVRMMFRVKAVDNRRGFKSYYWKATPNHPALTVEGE